MLAVIASWPSDSAIIPVFGTGPEVTAYISDEGRPYEHPNKGCTHNEASLELLSRAEDQFSGPRGRELVGVFA